MYKPPKFKPTTITAGVFKKGETIEQKVRRIQNNKEPISDGAPLIYTERKDGVQPQYDPRADRFDIALDAADTIHKTNVAKRQQRIDAWRESQKTPEQKAADAAAKEGKNDGGAESIQGTK